MDIGEKIRLLRVVKGWSQTELAEKINKTRPLISHIENTGKAHTTTLNLLLNAFEISHKEFDEMTETSLKYNSQEVGLNAKIERLTETVELLTRENEALRKLVELQESLLKGSSKRKK